MKRLLLKLQWWKKTPLKTHDDRIEEAQKEVDSALDVFESAKRKVVAANTNLDQVISEARADVERATATINNAAARKERNEKLHAKFAEMTLAD